MRKKSRMGCLTLAAMLCISNVSISAAEVNQEPAEVYVSTAKGASATEKIEINDVTLTPTGTANEYTVTKYDGSATEIDLTSGEFAGYTIVGIGDSVFNNKSQLTKVVLPNTITSIGNRAFYGCSVLTECKLPSGLMTIGERAFMNCSALIKCDLPSGLKVINESAFYGAGLTEVTIPASCTTINTAYNDGVFQNCKNLKKVTFEERTEDINLGKNTFKDCTSLTELHLPEQKISIPEGLCQGATALREVKISSKCTQIGKNAFSGCTSLTTINIPDTCESIGESAFYKTALSAVTIPLACNKIGASAFQECAALRSVTFVAPDPYASEKPADITIGASAFSGCKTLPSIALPSRATAIPDNAFDGCTQLAVVQISEGCTGIGTNAFNNCKAMKEIVIPKSCTSVLDYAFGRTDNLLKITFLNPDTSITTDAFRYGNGKMKIIADAGGAVADFAQEKNFGYQQPISSLTITKAPNKTVYNYGEDLLLDGIVITAMPTAEGASAINVAHGDCTITGYNKSAVGNQTITVTYGGQTATFPVKVVYNMTKASASAKNLVYTGEALTNTFTVKGYETNTALVEGVDYKVEYVGDQIAAGEKTAKIIGIGNYSGEKTVTYRVNPKNFSDIADLKVTVSDVQYTGSECKPAVTLTSGTKVIDPSNYTVEYVSNTNAGTATVRITAKNNYTGYANMTFKILPKSIEKAVITLDKTVYDYNGSPICPIATVTLDGEKLIDTRDYYVEYKNNDIAGTATALITGKGNYTDVLEVKFEIVQKSIENATVTFDETPNVYNGSPITPLPKVVVDGNLLEKDKDYTVDYKNNTNAGTGTVVITGKALYKGVIEQNFQIAQKPIQIATAKAKELEYTGVALTNTFEVKCSEAELPLTEGSDYYVEYVGDQIAAGEKTAKVIGKGNYSGEISVTYRVTPKSFQSMKDITVTVNDMEYTGGECKPAVTLMSGANVIDPANYTVAYSSNTAVGTATVTVTGINNYTGIVQGNFKVLPKSLGTATVTLDKTAYTYSGNANCPTPTVTVDGKTLTVHADYDVTYTNNTGVGTATVVITGKNNYTGTVEGKYEITPKAIDTATVTFDKTAYAYNGGAISPVATVTLDGKLLQKDVDYDVTFKNNAAVGTATAVITGKGFYVGTITKTFQINVDIGTITTVGVNSYLVTGMDTVMFRGVSGAATKVTIPDSVSIGGKVFKVTAIADKALKGSKAKNVTIGKNVTQIGKQAFSKASQLKKIVIKSTGLKVVGKKAFKGISKKATIKVPKKQYAAYAKLLKGKGQSKGVKIKK